MESAFNQFLVMHTHLAMKKRDFALKKKLSGFIMEEKYLTVVI